MAKKNCIPNWAFLLEMVKFFYSEKNKERDPSELIQVKFATSNTEKLGKKNEAL